MRSDEVEEILKKAMPDATVLVNGENCALEVIVISDLFEGWSPVKRQKLVYSHLSSLIIDGALHALSMRTWTVDEWRQRSVAS